MTKIHYSPSAASSEFSSYAGRREGSTMLTRACAQARPPFAVADPSEAKEGLDLGRRPFMDDRRFDNLTRFLVAPSRRSLLATAGGAALTTLLGGGGNGTLARKKRKKKKRKQTGSGCIPDCAGKECGGNGCGGECGACGAQETCSEGRCICVPSCGGKECGGNGCGGECGSCRAGDACQGSSCVCATAGALGPGETCESASECCPYPDVERFCTHGQGPCPAFLKVCRYGLGGKCLGSCDCEGDLECRGGSCACPAGEVYMGSGNCCPAGSRCGRGCCPPGCPCLCPPIGDCRCTPTCF
jgi:hypothetical protein